MCADAKAWSFAHPFVDGDFNVAPKFSAHLQRTCLRSHVLCVSPPAQNLHNVLQLSSPQSISGLVAEYIVAIDVTRVRFPADA